MILDSSQGSRSVPCSTIIIESSFCSRWQQKQRPTARHWAENERPGTLSPKWDFSINSFPLGLGKLFGRRGRRNTRARGMEDTRKTRSSNQHGQETEAAGTGSVPGALCMYYGSQFNILMRFLRVQMSSS